MRLTTYEIYHENKNHTSPEFPYNTYLCSIPLDFRSVKIHWHEEVEIIVVKKGEGIVSVDLTEYHVRTGDIIFVMSGQLHSIAQFENSTMQYENMLLKPSLLQASGNDLCWETYLSPLLFSSVSIKPVVNARIPAYKTIAEHICTIDQLCDKKTTGYQIAVKGHLYLVFYQLLSETITTVENSQKKQLEKIKKVLSYIETHYNENITIENMASLCFYSKSYFMKFFKQSMGISFISYLNNYRLELAVNMLTVTEDNILDIANACGFENLSYFNRSFKRKYGIAPGQYRKKLRKVP